MTVFLKRQLIISSSRSQIRQHLNKFLLINSNCSYINKLTIVPSPLAAASLSYGRYLTINTYIVILTKTQILGRIDVVNIRAVKNALKLNENVTQNYFSIGYKLIKICIYSSAATLKVVIKRL